MLTDLMGGEMTVSSRTTPSVSGKSDPRLAPDPAAGVGSADTQGKPGTLFRIRLFLPELRGASAPQPQAVRAAYAGLRRRLLVVDNEEVDRTLLTRRLQALGFEVLEAGSGAAALALLGTHSVDAILTDLAMPGMDGWETLRTIRRQGLSTAPVAVVSANAFEKGQDNDAGIGSADFITKPVRFDELLDWLGTHLQLSWLNAPALPPPPAVSASAPRPSPEQLHALLQVVVMGYPRGVHRVLDQIEASRPDCTAWLSPLRQLAQHFQFDRMTPLINEALARPHAT